MRDHTSPLQRQGGAVLIISLIMLLVLTLLGMSAMRNATLEEKMAGNTRDLNLAFNAAEAGLRGGEAALSGTAVLPPFSGTVIDETVTGNGYFEANTSLWRLINWSTQSLELTTTLAGVAAQPRYYLEEMPAVTSGGSLEAGVAMEVGMYRVTAIGYGRTDTAVAVLQSTFRR